MKHSKKKSFFIFLTFIFYISTPQSYAASPNIEKNSSLKAETKSEVALTPEAALEKLMAGNQRFVDDKAICPNRNSIRRLETSAIQKPFAVILGCSDSRVPPELAFDQGLGELFVVRVAGNVVGATELDSIEYSALQNGSVIIVVLGHERCGAVTAVMENKTQDIEAVANLIKPAVEAANKEHLSVDDAIEINVENSVAVIKQSSVIAKLIRENKIQVVGAYYNLDTGKVRILEPK